MGPCLMTNLQPQEGELHLQLSARMFLDMFPTITPNEVQYCIIRNTHDFVERMLLAYKTNPLADFVMSINNDEDVLPLA